MERICTWFLALHRAAPEGLSVMRSSSSHRTAHLTAQSGNREFGRLLKVKITLLCLLESPCSELAELLKVPTTMFPLSREELKRGQLYSDAVFGLHSCLLKVLSKRSNTNNRC